MRRKLLVAGLIATLATPSFATARTYCDQRSHDRKVAGTVIGGIGGALIGNAISRKNGALIGGVGGAVVGNQVARIKCDGPRRAYYRSGHTRYTHRYQNRGYDRASYAAPAACRYENRPYYDERGQLLYAPTRVCR